MRWTSVPRLLLLLSQSRGRAERASRPTTFHVFLPLMHLYSVTLQPPTAITHAVYGNFSSSKAQEVIVVRGQLLELLSPDDQGRMESLCRTNVFGQIRSILPFRLTGTDRDRLVIGSDSGKLVILEYDKENVRFKRVHEETYGKTGCRRLVPGQYMATDAKGRACMVAAVEKQKLVYILNQDGGEITITSPLEAHKSHTIVWDTVGLDVGFENPVFACLETDYQAVKYDAKEGERARGTAPKMLTFYELDLGLNHVVRKASERVDASASQLVAVPGDKDGPSGVLVVALDKIYFVNQEHPEVAPAVIPRRHGSDLARRVQVVARATHKQKDMFFFLLQSDEGDLFKVTLQYQVDVVERIDIVYFDTVPRAAALAVLKTGFLFVAAQSSAHHLYQFQGIGDDEPDYERVTFNGVRVPLFEPRALKNLLPLHDADCFAPLLHAHCTDLLKEGVPQLYALCGQGATSSLRIMRHSLPLTEAAVAPLDATPIAVWTVKTDASNEYDSYIVVSFVNATLVLSIEDDNMAEVQDSGLLGTMSTLLVHTIGQDSILQVHAGGWRMILADKRVQEWKTPGRKQVKKVTCNARQLVLSLSGGTLYYFELDALQQLTEQATLELGKDVACLDVAPLLPGQLRTRFLAVGDFDQTVALYSLQDGDVFAQIGMQVLPAEPSSLCMAAMGARNQKLYLSIGLHTGVLLRTQVDTVSGELSDTRTRFAGSAPVKLFRTTMAGRTAVLVLSSRSWLCYAHAQRLHMTPIAYERLDYAAPFANELCPEGLVAVAQNSVRIIALDSLDSTFSHHSVALRYTPRKMCVHEASGRLLLAESDHATQSYADRWATQVRRERAAAKLLDTDADADADADADGGNDDDEEVGEMPREALQQMQEYDAAFGRPLAGDGQWASCVRLFDPASQATLDSVELGRNEAATCLATVTFSERPEVAFVVVGSALALTLVPRSSAGGMLRVYALLDGATRLELIHATKVDEVPGALMPFQGRLLCGMGAKLRIYALGKKQLLRKCENRNFASQIISLQQVGTRIVVGDAADSVKLVSYSAADNRLFLFGDEAAPRWLSCVCVVDYDTVAGADKFGNVFVLRMSEEMSRDADADATGGRLQEAHGMRNGAPYKLEVAAHYFVGDLVTSLQKTSLSDGGNEVLVYTTLGGAIGALMPFVSRDEVDFFEHLEMHMRQVAPPLCGREHQAYRSTYTPVKAVVDGDLCATFFELDEEKRANVAEQLAKSVEEVEKKLEEIVNTRLG